MGRRTALARLGAGAGAVATGAEAAEQHAGHAAAAPAAGTYRTGFFKADELGLIDRVAEMILPADEHSPGAREAQVARYIDLVVSNSTPAVQAAWRERLAAFDALAGEGKGRGVLGLGPAGQAAVLDRWAGAEERPESQAERFFADMKHATLAGYYTSRLGLLDELGYIGNQVLGEFPGCRHEPGKHSEGI